MMRRNPPQPAGFLHHEFLGLPIFILGVNFERLSRFARFKFFKKRFPQRSEVGDGFPEKVDVSRSLAIHWANHPDYYENYKVLEEPLTPTVQEGEKWVANKQRAGDGELQTGNLPSSQNNEVHTVEDVPLTASGPGAEQFHKTMDNTEVFFAIVNALGLDARQGKSPFVATR